MEFCPACMRQEPRQPSAPSLVKSRPMTAPVVVAVLLLRPTSLARATRSIARSDGVHLVLTLTPRHGRQFPRDKLRHWRRKTGKLARPRASLRLSSKCPVLVGQGHCFLPTRSSSWGGDTDDRRNDRSPIMVLSRMTDCYPAARPPRPLPHVRDELPGSIVSAMNCHVTCASLARFVMASASHQRPSRYRAALARNERGRGCLRSRRLG
ncbi:uncharacterized protein B0H64DRAFT_30548 [Chaetomium fimeti]|uniref:Uncharacterized protein n=1 Tax=Chaetomium fimeti TaxID=1854472 RepID=A0AAE0HR98_9PEZI|nr:hypothetical protein B0H64DRAFT_30548 [Chaetomium fimeti]